MAKRRGGFTLIELLITVVILGIVAALALGGSYDKVRRRTQIASMKSDLRVISIHQELYYQEHDRYAPGSSLLDYFPSAGVTVTVNFADGYGWAATATHKALPGTQCGIFVGVAPPEKAVPATEQGVIACQE